MPLLTLNKVSLAYGHHPLLAKVDFNIEPGERVCLVGRNGTGKSTLFRVITGAALPDEGEVWRPDTLRVSYLEQQVPHNTPDTVFDVVAGGLGELGKVFSDYQHALHDIGEHDQSAMDCLADLQHQIDVAQGWNIQQKVETVISRLDLPAQRKLDDCSGGMRRRVMLARALVSDPDLLLLDEPTNHMDITAIQWLEEFLLNYKGALIFITHDRTFLKHLATRLIELDRGVLSSFPGDYETYQLRKAEMINAEEKANARFDKQLADNEVWIRQGVKARRTRNEGRVTQLINMRRERSDRISVQGKASMQIDSGEASGRLVADLRHVTFNYGDTCIIRDLSTRIMRGDRIGIIGPNGSGKSTLLKLILGELQPSSGQVVIGTRLETAYFDQHRELLDLEKTVRNNMSNNSDFIEVKGKSRHVISYLRDFLFPAERMNAPVKILSGGERNRLLLAKLFTKTANMLVLDEPTNDLDVETLELLEELLCEYDGTLLLVSHDRAFLDNVVTSTLVFEGDGVVKEYVGGYEDWLRQRKSMDDQYKVLASATEKSRVVSPVIVAAPKQRLSYKEQREVEALPKQIEALEQQKQQIEQQIGVADFYQQDKEKITATLTQLDGLEKELKAAYGRWEYLEAMRG
jgi:ATP-binding cassette subfamily F protein uup